MDLAQQDTGRRQSRTWARTCRAWSAQRRKAAPAQKGSSSPWVENSSGGEATGRRVGNKVIRRFERKAVRFGG